MLRWLWLSFLIIALDQVTKVLAEAYLQYGPYNSVEVMPFLNWTLLYNKGAAFSFLSDAGGWQRWFFAVIAAAVSVFLIGWLHKLKQDRWLAIAVALVLGGAIGNLFDRVAYGHVIDFIDVYYQQWHWPAFNIADSAICVGAVMLVIDAFVKKPVADEKPSSS